MEKQNPASDFLQFLIGGCLFGAGGFLLANQVMVGTTHINQVLVAAGVAFVYGQYIKDVTLKPIQALKMKHV